MNLDNFDDYKKLDLLGVGDALRLFPDQIKRSWNQAEESNIPKMQFTSVLISGMGGSSNAAKIIESLVQNDSKFPLTLYNDYGLPGWVNEDTLVVANSYSGNTEETLSAITEAKKRKCNILGVSTGGKIGGMITSGEINGVIIDPGQTNPPNFPKSGLGVSLGALMGALAKVEAFPLFTEGLHASLADLEDIRKNWLPDKPIAVNLAKQLAGWWKDSIPVLLGGRPFLGSLNAARNVICEVGRTFSLFFDFPEVNHVFVEATLKPEFAIEKINYLFMESNYNHERVKLRYKVTKDIFEEQGLDYKTYNLQGNSELSQSLEIPHLAAWVGYYLSILSSKDPGPEPWILKLKSSLSQPLH